ncbi:sodium-and chloride-dependent transporter [Helicobacter sp. CLO-3]|uniref:sodium-dependent transporter n=1 Tax=unclassified Helicobacter TaxID=2593540 RepID=UPI0008051EBB|nr:MULTISPECIES: sodium-dependent transporter [unclassified Helicobacter]OBV28645.1 sodium-and chloride-dependent transporter [Helicobacter sp. CLO-3]OHU83091.1 sodium-and chloride-dependent transporter [Helicobacter sp. CLO-3]
MNTFSKFGFILATLGSSIGLGHIWRFPYMAGEMGGGAFVLLFLLLTMIVGVAMLVGEMLMGNRTQKNAADAFIELDPSPQKPWRFAGLVLIGGPFILTFYAVVLGWVVYYLFGVSMDLPQNASEADFAFSSLLTSQASWQILGFSVVMGLTGLVVALGIKDGIERLNLVLMPLLFVIFIGLLIYAAFQPSFMRSVHFLFDFKYYDINFDVIISAMGQMCFSLSLGIGIIITYSAATDKDQNLLESALWVAICGVLISLIAGVMIFTFVYEYDVKAMEGAGLVFKALPIVFGKMGFSGVIVSVLFFLGLAFAGITSAISLLEPSVMFFVQRYEKNRKVITWSIVAVIYAVGLVLIFSLHQDYERLLSAFGKNLFSWVDGASSAIIMPLGALISVIFVGYFVGKARVREMTRGFLSERAFGVWFFVIRYIAPLVVIVAWAGKILDLWFGRI